VLWNPADFHPLALAVLQTHAGKLLPLSAGELQPEDPPHDLMSIDSAKLFPHARDARAALSGLLLLAGQWDLSHEVSQTVASREGSYWHAIAHRIEPDSSNAAYWFTRVGEHPIFNPLREESAALLAASKTNWRLGTELHQKNWDTNLFAKWCDEARKLPASEKYRVAREIQQAECNLLFTWCAVKTNDL
jgi:hypothetical protein